MKIKHFVLTGVLAISSQLAHADDWPCTVLLCMLNPAGPTAVAECVPSIQRLWRELARGHGFPFCDTGSSNGYTNGNVWANENNCPPQYLVSNENTDVKQCLYTGYVSILTNGVETSRVWWNSNGSVTQNLTSDAPVNDSTLKFDADYAAWKAAEDARLAKQAEDAGRGD